ncbi:MAG: hypothetical protein ABIS03_07325, partial [Gemmatimonadaceae bacterium]
IQQARSEAANHLRIVPASRPVRANTWIGLAAAAVLLLATGVSLGRLTRDEPRTVSPPIGPVNVAAATPDARPTAIDSSPVLAPNPETRASELNAATTPSAPRSREEIRRNPVVVATGRGLRPIGGTGAASVPNGGLALAPNANAYQVATVRHLADAEALLTSFSLASRDATMNAQFSEWARGLLSNTRLLLDSPAGDDPRRARLLQDLELVLAQMAQLSPGASGLDRELVNGSIEQGQVMARLRTAIPADQPRGILER